jgi:hypothetical protein
MAWNWWEKLTESEETRKEREFHEFAKTEDFRKMLHAEAKSIVEESKKQDEEDKNKAKADHKKRIDYAKKNLSELGQEMTDSPEPFVSVLSIGFTAENGIEVKLDYNKSFIRYLKKAGIKASNDEETIRLWLAHLNYDISEEAKAEDYLMNGVSDNEMPSMSYDELFGVDDDDEDELDSGWEQSSAPNVPRK